ncbi:MAG: GNAT family N-acetyltransferase [Candidatus Marinimicrobia bacterium]|nr:GNAT family N-acetyltransferase [Candidatus Neomarinimicrobiota bacterium]
MITVKRFNNNSSAWDNFVSSANNGTLFHTRRFLNYHHEGRFNDHSLEFYKKGKLVGVFPAALIETGNKRQLVSHPGASVGSFVVPEDLAFADALEMVEQLVDYSKRENLDGIKLTQTPTIYSKRLSHYIDFALQKNGFLYSKREISSILFLEKSIDENLSKFKSTHRTAVRKAEKSGVVVKETDDFASFYEILKKNLSIRHDVKPTHSLDELLHLKELFPDKINLFGAYIEEKMVAGVINFIATENVVLAFYISHNEDFQEVRPINLLFYKIFEWAIQKKYNVFDFGIFTVNEEPNMGLARFKENFGASGQFRDTMEIHF